MFFCTDIAKSLEIEEFMWATPGILFSLLCQQLDIFLILKALFKVNF